MTILPSRVPDNIVRLSSNLYFGHYGKHRRITPVLTPTLWARIITFLKKNLRWGPLHKMLCKKLFCEFTMMILDVSTVANFYHFLFVKYTGTGVCLA